jgi:hypothetical protein
MNRSIMRWLLLGLVVFTFSAASFGQLAVGVSVRIGPPPLPVYAQPICPGPGYYWTPGYWAWSDDDGYYWVPGTWVIAPVGMLWTPGYWGWGGGLYIWHAGYWGPHVGFYGGINYGFGYTGMGYRGGEWRGRSFYYNRSVTNVSVTNVTNVYNRTVIVHNSSTTSFNGGRGGINARPSRDEARYVHERHMDVLPAQREHEHAAGRERQNFAAENHGRPVIAATARPADFSRHSAVPARAAGGEYHPPAMSPREARGGPNHGNGGGRPNEGYRPFNPPAKGGASANDRGGNSMNRNDSRPNNSRLNDNRPNDNRPSENRMRESRPADNRVNQNRPADNRMSPGRPNENRPPENRMNENRPSENRMNQNRPADNRSQERRPPSQPREAARPAPAPRESRPAPAPAPRHQNAPPKDDHKRGR